MLTNFGLITGAKIKERFTNKTKEILSNYEAIMKDILSNYKL